MAELNLKSIPKSPGIYQFFNKDGKIIYIGKGINLFTRVNSYFKTNATLNFGKKKMVSEVTDIKTIVVNNEKESLILETTLIKKYLPKYNILMKDDKNHLYIKITDEVIPKVIKTRIKPPSNSHLAGGEQKGTYFGPYISSSYVSNILKITKKIFGHRSCNIVFISNSEKKTESTVIASNSKAIQKTGNNAVNGLLHTSQGQLNEMQGRFPTSREGQNNTNITIKSANGTKIPCIDYYTKRCAGPCLLGEKEVSEYKKSIENIKNFIDGDFKNVIVDLQEKMIQKAKELKFEEANSIKQDIESIKSLEENQIVRDYVKGDFDVINYIEKFDKIYIGLVSIRDSKINDFRNYEVETKLDETIEEVLLEFVEREVNLEEKKTILLPIEISVIASETKQSSKHGINNKTMFSGSPHFVRDDKDKPLYSIEIPKSGPKHDLLKFVYKNIYEYAYKKHLDSLSTKGFTKQTMKNLLKILGYKEINKDLIFECNDISHLSGSHTIASRSIIENGKLNKNKYRKFNIKTLPDLKIDDFGSMKEIMTRRIKELLEKGNLPDLIIIDGGIGQLSSVVEVIENEKRLLFSVIPAFSSVILGLDPGISSKVELIEKTKDSNILKSNESKEFSTSGSEPIDSLSSKEGQHRNNSEGQLSEIHGRFPTSREGQLLNSLQLVSIAKREEELFLPGIKKPIILDKDSQELRLIQKLRDEAHRFAITFNREKRLKSEKKNLLESIPGIGPKTRTKLTKTYGNIDNLKSVSKDELSKILSKNQIEALENHGIIG